MAITFSEILLGTMTLERNGQQFEVQIRQGNCLAVFITESETHYHLYWFFGDEKHLKRIKKAEGWILPDKIISCRLDTSHKESMTLLKHLVNEGVEVTCYKNIKR